MTAPSGYVRIAEGNPSWASVALSTFRVFLAWRLCALWQGLSVES